MAVFTVAKGGLMYQAAVGGQKFKFAEVVARIHDHDRVDHEAPPAQGGADSRSRLPEAALDAAHPPPLQPTPHVHLPDLFRMSSRYCVMLSTCVRSSASVMQLIRAMLEPISR